MDGGIQVTMSDTCRRAGVTLLAVYTIAVVVVPWAFDFAQWLIESGLWLLAKPYDGVTKGFNGVSATVSAFVPPIVRAGLDIAGLGLGLVLLMLAILFSPQSIWLKFAALVLSLYVVTTLTGSVAQKLKMPLAFRTPELIEFAMIFATVVLFIAEVIRREWNAPTRTRSEHA